MLPFEQNPVQLALAGFFVSGLFDINPFVSYTHIENQ
jgi:hypothetical protein